jgi:hypothetical protein
VRPAVGIDHRVPGERERDRRGHDRGGHPVVLDDAHWASSSKRGIVATVAPWQSAFKTTQIRPMQWYIGATARTVS